MITTVNRIPGNVLLTGGALSSSVRLLLVSAKERLRRRGSPPSECARFLLREGLPSADTLASRDALPARYAFVSPVKQIKMYFDNTSVYFFKKSLQWIKNASNAQVITYMYRYLRTYFNDPFAWPLLRHCQGFYILKVSKSVINNIKVTIKLYYLPTSCKSLPVCCPSFWSLKELIGMQYEMLWKLTESAPFRCLLTCLFV